MRSFVTNELQRLIGESGMQSFTIEYIVTSIPDFDADKIQPQLLASSDSDEASDEEDFADMLEDRELHYSYNPASDSKDFNRYLRKLESINVNYLVKYMKEALYAAAKYKDSIVRTQINAYVSQLALVDAESGTAVSESDLELDVDINAWSFRETSDALKKMPYVLKRLHNLSILCGVHILSMAAAYLRAKELNDRNCLFGSTKTLKVNDVTDFGIYLCDSFGNATYAPDRSAKNLRIAEMFKWYIGQSDQYNAYRTDLNNYIHYADVLNIDIARSDMYTYCAEFASNLVITTVTPATQYDPEVFNALNGKACSGVSYDNNIIESTIGFFYELYYSVPELRKRSDLTVTMQDRICMLHMAAALAMDYYESKGMRTIFDKYKFVNGFLSYNGEMCIIGTERFMNVKHHAVCAACILSDTGLVIGVKDDTCVYGVALANAYKIYCSCMTGYPDIGLDWFIWRDC